MRFFVSTWKVERRNVDWHRGFKSVREETTNDNGPDYECVCQKCYTTLLGGESVFVKPTEKRIYTISKEGSFEVHATVPLNVGTLLKYEIYASSENHGAVFRWHQIIFFKKKLLKKDCSDGGGFECSARQIRVLDANANCELVWINRDVYVWKRNPTFVF